MTEEEWRAGRDPAPMLEFLRAKTTARKLRLFQVACCRRIWGFVTDPGSRAVVDITERAADAPVDVQEVLALPYDWLTDDCGGPGEPGRSAFMAAGHIGFSILGPVHGVSYPSDDWQDALHAARNTASTLAISQDKPGDEDDVPLFQRRVAAEQAVQGDLLRCIVGNPFRPVLVSSSSLTPTVTTLARRMYDSRDFSAMPILADALQDAGCDTADVLDHCRGPGPHVRGCWVVDLITGTA